MDDETKLKIKTRKEQRFHDIYQDDKYERLWDRKDTERFVLKDFEWVNIQFLDGDIVQCKLLELGAYDYYVELKKKGGGTVRAIIKKHAVKMIVLEG